MVNQVEAAYENPSDDAITATDNPEVKKVYDQVIQAGITDGLSAKLQQWSDDWTAQLPEGRLRHDALPRLDARRHRGQRQGRQGLGRRQRLPRRRRQLGRLVPDRARSRAPTSKEAQELADWLTAPEQQIKAFEKAGTFPSQSEALESPDAALASTNAFFNNAPTGQIFADRAKAVTVTPYKGTALLRDQRRDAAGPDPRRATAPTPQESWDKWVGDVKALG